MEEIRSAASAYHVKLFDKEKKDATKLNAEKVFETLYAKGNGKIRFRVYKESFKVWEKHEKHITDPKFFKILDNDSDGLLDKQDIITLSYLVNTGKLRFCNSCEEFLKGPCFTCVECFTRSTDGKLIYRLCSVCYGLGIFSHNEDHVQFTDDDSLLLKMRLEAAKTAPPATAHKLKLDPNLLLSQILVASLLHWAIFPGVDEAIHLVSHQFTSHADATASALSDHATSASDAASAGIDHHISSASDAASVGTDHLASIADAASAGTDHIAYASDYIASASHHVASASTHVASAAADPGFFADLFSNLFNF
ncbi:Parvalbumin [Parasponia andersonii]|uniref:Parvalbumin n=1 Tax=Parasponia andersonii TaxID=3476 RepID=A0A2P5BR39_PARAD|nr:Parvalbumin [Parasponia andersonii]